jgi:hypothetical protein
MVGVKGDVKMDMQTFWIFVMLILFCFCADGKL